MDVALKDEAVIIFLTLQSVCAYLKMGLLTYVVLSSNLQADQQTTYKLE